MSIQRDGLRINKQIKSLVCVFCVRREDLWGEASRARQTLLDARLFLAFMPKGGTIGLDGVRFLLGGSGSIENWRSAWRLSLREVLSLIDQQRELQWREKLLFRAGRRRAADTLKSHAAHNLLPSMRAAVLGGKHTELLSMLDSGEEKMHSHRSAINCVLLLCSVLYGHIHIPSSLCLSVYLPACFFLFQWLHRVLLIWV